LPIRGGWIHYIDTSEPVVGLRSSYKTDTHRSIRDSILLAANSSMPLTIALPSTD
jgi:hypothetical protein